jgi:hypothetical protein
MRAIAKLKVLFVGPSSNICTYTNQVNLKETNSKKKRAANFSAAAFLFTELCVERKMY